jgi:hypothetical protein
MIFFLNILDELQQRFLQFGFRDHTIIHKAVEKTFHKYCWAFPETTNRANQFSVLLSFLMGIVHRASYLGAFRRTETI